MAPSNVNNAARELMGHMRDMYEQLGDGYFEFGDGDGTYTVARGDADTITITSSADISGIYFAGRKIRITDGGANVVEGTIASSSHSSTTQTVNLTGISLASGTPTKVELGIDTAAFGGRIILDDDGDTYIEAVTDDTIDIYVAGAKDFVITANTFTAESGSTIAAQALTATTVTATGEIDGASLDIEGDADINGTTNLDVVDIDGAVNMATTALVTGVLTTTATTVFNGGFTSNDGSTITTADNTDTLTLTSSDADAVSGPNLNLYRNSANPADGDQLGYIHFKGRNDNSQDVTYAKFLVHTDDVSDGEEDGDVFLQVITAGTLQNYVSMLAVENQPEVVINDGSIDMDFRVESNGDANMLFVDGGDNDVRIGTATSFGPHDAGLKVKGDITIGDFTADSASATLGFIKTRNTTVGSQTIISNGDEIGRIAFRADDGDDTSYNNNVAAIFAQIDGTPGTNDTPGRLIFETTADGARVGTERLRINNAGFCDFVATSNDLARFSGPNSGGINFRNATANEFIMHTSTSDALIFGTNGNNERMRIHSDGNISIGRATVDTTNAGISLEAVGALVSVRDAGVCVIANRLSDDGEIIRLVQAGTTEGSISVSGSTISYNAFTGSHWSRLADNSKPSILVGTIMESLDSMINWYQAVADVAEVKYTADDAETQDAVLYTSDDQEVIDGDKNVGDIKTLSTKQIGDVKTKAHTIKEDIALPDGKSVGDAVTFTYYGTEYTGVYAKESDVKHVHSKVSDSADSTRVYGVFHCWGNDNVADVNDMEIAQVGTYIIRVHKDVTVSAGDLLVSNGDGTAKKQDDDIIRSKTIAKVNSNIKVETYADGSYTVPCTLHC